MTRDISSTVEYLNFFDVELIAIGITEADSLPLKIVILTLVDPFDNSIQPSFFYQATGLTFRDNRQIKCLALTGFGSTSFPIQLNVDQLQATLKTQGIHTPSLTALMSTHSKHIDVMKTLLPKTTI